MSASRIKKKRIRWDPSPSPSVVGYRLYWAVVGDVSYDSEFIDLGNRTEIVLPDRVPSLHRVAGKVALGVTAVSRGGNESDMVRFRADFDSPVQRTSEGLVRLGQEGWEPPTRASILVDDLHFWLISRAHERGQGPDTRDYYIESHHVEEARR